AFNYPTIHAYFQMLKDFLEENDIPWENLYNVDEKGVQLGRGHKNSQIRYFFVKFDAMMYQTIIFEKSNKLVTIVDCVCADGTAEIPPCFVFPGQ
ncbi:hypothetical protein BDP27DRAFT_1167005, partial [Rhodocollybia butyracea]